MVVGLMMMLLVPGAPWAAQGRDTGASSTSTVYLPLLVSRYPQPRLAFVSGRNGSVDIFTMNDDGSGLIQLTTSPDWEYGPRWSPDGRRLVYTSEMSATSEVSIYVMNADGTEKRRLSGNAHLPAWSPDGRKIAFVSNEHNGIYVINADGTGLLRLTTQGLNLYPAWAPDGQRIAFTSFSGNGVDIYLMNADGTNLINLTNTPDISEHKPAWSPDGTKIAFEASGTYLIYVMNADGSGQINLTRSLKWAAWMDWAPDGQKLVFAGDGGIHVVNVDGSGLTQLTNAADNHPVWSRDGQRIAFTSQRDGSAEIYVMNADGSNQTRLTNNVGGGAGPVWQP